MIRPPSFCHGNPSASQSGAHLQLIAMSACGYLPLETTMFIDGGSSQVLDPAANQGEGPVEPR